jgi:hypothetical protein
VPTSVTTARPTAQVCPCVSAREAQQGMQTYPENAPDTLLLGGEVLVLDVALLQSQRCTRRTLARLVSDVSKGAMDEDRVMH